MKLIITRTDVVHVDPVPGTPGADGSPPQQLAAFRAAYTKTIFDDDAGHTHDTSDGEWEYTYLDHVNVQVAYALDYVPPPKDEEP